MKMDEGLGGSSMLTHILTYKRERGLLSIYTAHKSGHMGLLVHVLALFWRFACHEMGVGKCHAHRYRIVIVEVVLVVLVVVPFLRVVIHQRIPRIIHFTLFFFFFFFVFFVVLIHLIAIVLGIDTKAQVALSGQVGVGVHHFIERRWPA